MTNYIIGITGVSCSGKSKFARLLVEELKKHALACKLIDVDKLGHESLKRKRDEVVFIFGAAILNSDNQVDRTKLSKIVFASETEFAKLKKIVYPDIKAQIQEIISNEKETICVFDAATLFEIELNSLCNVIYLVSSAFILRLFRGIKREMRNKKISFLQAYKRIISIFSSQKNLKIQLLKKADENIINIENWIGELKTKVLVEVDRIRHERER